MATRQQLESIYNSFKRDLLLLGSNPQEGYRHLAVSFSANEEILKEILPDFSCYAKELHEHRHSAAHLDTIVRTQVLKKLQEAITKEKQQEAVIQKKQQEILSNRAKQVKALFLELASHADELAKILSSEDILP